MKIIKYAKKDTNNFVDISMIGSDCMYKGKPITLVFKDIDALI